MKDKHTLRVLKRQGFFQQQNKFDRTMKIHSKIIITMDNILSRFIYEQNKDLLERIAKDKFTTDEERQGFIKNSVYFFFVIQLHNTKLMGVMSS